MESRGFLTVSAAADPAAFFSLAFLTPVLERLIGKGEGSRAIKIAEKLEGKASEQRAIEAARLIAGTPATASAVTNAPDLREDVYVPLLVPGREALAQDVGLKWRSEEGQRLLEIKYSDKPIASLPPGATPSFFKKSTNASEFLRSDGKYDCTRGLVWAADALAAGNREDAADAMRMLATTTPGEARYDFVFAGDMRLGDCPCPMVLVSKARAKKKHEALFKGADDTYKIEATYVRMQTVAPPTATPTDNDDAPPTVSASAVLMPPRAYLTLCFENDNDAMPAIVNRTMDNLAAAWSALLEGPNAPSTLLRDSHKASSPTVIFDGYPGMAVKHAKMDLRSPNSPKL
jgi:hypothetical protein